MTGGSIGPWTVNALVVGSNPTAGAILGRSRGRPRPSIRVGTPHPSFGRPRASPRSTPRSAPSPRKDRFRPTADVGSLASSRPSLPHHPEAAESQHEGRAPSRRGHAERGREAHSRGQFEQQRHQQAARPARAAVPAQNRVAAVSCPFPAALPRARRGGVPLPRRATRYGGQHPRRHLPPFALAQSPSPALLHRCTQGLFGGATNEATGKIRLGDCLLGQPTARRQRTERKPKAPPFA